MKKWLGAALLLVAGQAGATAISFDDMGDASAYIFGDFHGQYNDSQHGLLIGGNATFSNYSIATLNNTDDLSLVVGGDLSINGGDLRGLASVDGSTGVTSSSALNTSAETKNFDQDYFISLSNTLALQPGDTGYDQWGATVFSGASDADTVFFNTTADAFDNIWGLMTEDLFEGTRLVFNVAGEDVTLGSIDWLVKDKNYAFNHRPENVLFNFYEAKSLTISGGFYGSILAAGADVYGSHGHVNGQLIANSFTGSTQLNDGGFNVDSDPGTTPQQVDEPATYPLLALATCFLLYASRKKLKAQRGL